MITLCYNNFYSTEIIKGLGRANNNAKKKKSIKTQSGLNSKLKLPGIHCDKMTHLDPNLASCVAL